MTTRCWHVGIQDSSSEDEPVMATAIASDSDEEVVFTKPNVAGSAAVQRDEEDASHPKTRRAGENGVKTTRLFWAGG